MFVTDLLDHGLRRNAHSACVIQGDVRWSFAEVDDRAARLVTALRAAGVHAGDRVAYLGMNEPEFLELQVASQRVEAIFVPLNFRLARPELEDILSDSQPRLLVHGPGFEDSAKTLGIESLWHLGAQGAGSSYDALLAAAAPAERGVLLASTVAQLTYTSGTTGRAKGAVVTNGALQTRIAAFKSTNPITTNDVLLQTLPMFHLASLVSYAFTASGAACVTVKEFDPVAVLGLAEREQVTHTLMVPTIIDALATTLPSTQADLSALRTIFYGASPITPAQLSRARQAFACGMSQLYGMTEAGIGVMLAPEDHDAERRPHLMAAAGRDLSFFRIDVVRADDTLADVGEVGEVTFSGGGLMEGYWNRPDATAATIRNGRLHSGDAGYVDTEGYLFITDRLKDMIITGGENVYCGEVESVISEFPGVLEVAVIGLPDDYYGQRVHAIVVAERDVNEGDLVAHCRERLAGYKCPRSIELAGQLPRNALGKVLKHRLRDERAEVHGAV